MACFEVVSQTVNTNVTCFTSTASVVVEDRPLTPFVSALLAISLFKATFSIPSNRT